jgi:isoleucyl-tRNA synthetase
VANLYDFDPETDRLPLDHLDAVDRFALARYGQAAERMRRAYDEYDFSTVSQAMNTLATVDLSAFYVDVTKDRMYTLGARSRERRSTQTAMYVICEGLAKLLAPILPVTADDLWRHIPGARSASVHLEDFPKVEGLADEALLSEWEELLRVREQVNGALEQKRKDKVIGTSLGARVVLRATGPIAELLDRHRAELPMLLNVSAVALTVVSTSGDSTVDVETEKAPGVKCARCWRFVPSVRTEPEWAGICDRCVEALGGDLAA